MPATTIKSTASQITGVSMACSTVCSGADQSKHQSSASLAIYGGNSPVTGGFPSQKANNAERVSMWWRLHGRIRFCCCCMRNPCVILWSAIIHNKVNANTCACEFEIVSVFVCEAILPVYLWLYMEILYHYYHGNIITLLSLLRPFQMEHYACYCLSTAFHA